MEIVERFKSTDLLENTDEDWIQREMEWTKYAEEAEENIFEFTQLKRKREKLERFYGDLVNEHKDLRKKHKGLVKKQEIGIWDTCKELFEAHKDLKSRYEALDKEHKNLDDKYKELVTFRMDLQHRHVFLGREHKVLENQYKDLMTRNGYKEYGGCFKKG